MPAKYIQLADTLRLAIYEGNFRNSNRLPTEQQLVEQFGVSRQTVRKALEVLTHEQLIQRRQGSGSIILDPKATSTSNTIAVIVGHVNDYIFPSLLMDAQQVLRGYNYSTLVYSTDNRVEREREVLQQLLEHPVRGLIIECAKSALPNPNLDLFARLERSGLPIVCLHGKHAPLKYPCIQDDNEAGGYIATRHLLERGHTKIGGIFKSDDNQGLERYAGMMNALRDAHCSFCEDMIFWYDTCQRHDLLEYTSTQWLESIVDHLTQRCTAVVCYNDEVAYRLLQALHKRSISVPRQLAVVSFDNSYYSSMSDVGLTSLAHNTGKMGRIAAEALLELIHGRPAQSQHLPWKLIQRGSS